MNSPMITILSLHFLSHLQRASSSQDLLTIADTMSEDDADVGYLESFFSEFGRAYLRKHDPNYIVIIGSDSQHLQQVNPVFKGFPYSVYSDMEISTHQEEFGSGSFLIIFLEDMSRETFGKMNESLSRCGGCRALFLAHSTVTTVTVDQVLLIFMLASEQHMQYIEFALLENDAIKLYSNFIATNCSMQVRPVTVWRPGVALDNIHHWAFHLKDLNGCPISVSSLTFVPKMMIEENKDGSLTVAGGQEGKMLLAIADGLNFTIVLQNPSVVDRRKYSRKMSIINDVVNETVEIGIGRIRPTNELRELVAFSVAYDEECVTWGVPRSINWPYSIVWVEFSWEVWAYIGVVFCLSCGIEYSHQNMSFTKNGGRTSRGFVTGVLDVLAIHLGNPIIHVSSFRGGKFMLLASLWYTLIVITAYKSSLAAILATNEGTSSFADADGILAANLAVGGSAYDYDILKDQADDSDLNLRLLEKFSVNNNDTQCLHELTFNDFAFLARLSSLNYHRLRIMRTLKTLPFDVLNGCVLTYPVVMTFQKKSFLRNPANGIIQRLTEAGILEHWDLDDINTEKIVAHQIDGKYFDDRAFHNFRTIFILYSGCMVFCFVTFLIELLLDNDFTRKYSFCKSTLHQ